MCWGIDFRDYLLLFFSLIFFLNICSECAGAMTLKIFSLIFFSKEKYVFLNIYSECAGALT